MARRDADAPLRAPRERHARRARRAALISLGAAVIGAPLLLGGGAGWTVSLIAVLCGAAALAAGWLAWERPSSATLRPAILVLAVAATWTLVQALPLPCGVVSALSHESAEASTRTADVLGGDPVCTISIDPGRTREELVKGAALLAVAVAAFVVAARVGREPVLRIIAASTLALAAVVLAHLLTRAETVYGIDALRSASVFAGPIPNPNVVGGLTAMGVPLCVGLALAEHDLQKRYPWLAGAMLLVVMTLLTLSRGAALELLVGSGLFAVLMRRARGSDPRDVPEARRRLLWTLGPAAAGAGLMVALFFVEASPRDTSELTSTDASKLDLILQALRVGVGGPWVGFGRGAFTVAFLPHDPDGRERSEAAENFVAQWATDWGLPFAVLVIGVLTMELVRAVRSARRPATLGAVAACIAYAFQNLGDLGLELLGPATVAAALLGTIVADAPGTHHSSEDEPAEDPRPPHRGLAHRAWAVGIASIGLAVVLGQSIERDRVQNELATLRAALDTHDHARFVDELTRAVRAHPAEPTLAVVAGTEAFERRNAMSIRWANRAMQLAPNWTAPHAIAAWALDSMGRRTQAMLEIREAATRHLEGGLWALMPLLAHGATATDLETAAPRGETAQSFLEQACAAIPPDSAGANDTDVELNRAHPTLVTPRVRIIRREVARGETELAVESALALVRDVPDDPAARMLAAEVLLAANRPTEAIDQLDVAARSAGFQWSATRMLVLARAAAHDMAGAREAASTLRGIAGSDPARIAEAAILRGQIEEGAGNEGAALGAYENAARIHASPDALLAVMRVSTSLGDTERAFGARRSLCAEWPATPICNAPLAP